MLWRDVGLAVRIEETLRRMVSTRRTALQAGPLVAQSLIAAFILDRLGSGCLYYARICRDGDIPSGLILTVLLAATRWRIHRKGVSGGKALNIDGLDQ